MAQEQHHHTANTDVVTGGGHHPATLSSPTTPLLCDTNQTRSSQTTDCTDGGGSSLFASSLPFSPPSDDAPSVACLSSASPSSSSSRASSSSSASSLAGAFQPTASTNEQLPPTSEASIVPSEPCSSSVEPTSEPLPPPVSSQSSQSLSTPASPQQEMTKTAVPQYEKEKEEDEEAEEEEAYFEERSWKDTEDYAVLIETMEQLHEQRMQALIDMTQLSVLKETFLSDPLTLLNRLHCNRVEDFPQPQHVVELPEIDFSKYAHYAVHDQPLSHYVELALDNYTSSLSSRSSVSSSSHRSFGKKISSTKSSKLAPKHSSSVKKKTKKKAKLTASTKNKQKNSRALNLKDGTASTSESNKMKERGTQAEKTSRSHGNEKTIVHNTTGKKNVSVHPKVQVKLEKLSDGEQEERKSQNMGVEQNSNYQRGQGGEIKRQNTNAKTNTKKTRRKDAKQSSHSSMGVTIKREKGESNEDEVVNICDDSDEEVNPPKLPTEQLEQPKQEEKEKETVEKEKEKKEDNNVTTESNASVDSQPSTYKKAWSQEEIKRLQQLLIEYPEEQIASHRWEKIARALGNRTPRQVASKCQKYFLKLAMAGLPVPGKVPNVEAHLQRKRREKLKKAASRAQSAEVTYFKPPVVYMSDDEDDARATATSATNLPTNNNRNDAVATTSTKTTSDDNNKRSSNGMRKRKKAPSGEKRRDNEIILRKKAKKLTQHHGFKCASCKKEPIVGIRWRCKDCEAAFTTTKTTNSTVESTPLGAEESKETKADGSTSESSSTSTSSSSKSSMVAAVVDLCESCYKKGTFESGSHTRQHNRFVPISSASSESDSLGFFYDSDYLTFATEKQPNYLDPSFMPS